LEAKAQWRAKPLEGDVEPEITLLWHQGMDGDRDNFHKLSCDALTGAVYVDDSRIRRVRVNKLCDKERLRIEVVAWALKAAS